MCKLVAPPTLLKLNWIPFLGLIVSVVVYYVGYGIFYNESQEFFVDQVALTAQPEPLYLWVLLWFLPLIACLTAALLIASLKYNWTSCWPTLIPFLNILMFVYVIIGMYKVAE
jgi:hypothetical protein